MENKGTVKPRLTSAHKAVAVRPPRPATAPTPPLPRGAPHRPSTSSSGSRSASGRHAASDATSHSAESDFDESNSGETDSEASSESVSDDDDDDDDDNDNDSPSSSSRMNGDGGRFLPASDHVSSWDQLPDRCLRDRCLRPLSKLQQQNFLTSGKEQHPQAEPEGLIWQNSGFMTPFTPDLVTLKRGQSRQISTAATGVSIVLDSGRHEHWLWSQEAEPKAVLLQAV